MAFDFPTSPADGQVANGYAWSASKGAWMIVGAGALSTVNTLLYLANATYVPSPGLTFAEIETLGSGGGGGGITQASANQGAGGGGGGSGSKSRSILSAAAIGASQVITIGNAGVGGAAGNNNGTAGSPVSFGSLVTSLGGGGGGFSDATVQNGAGGAGGAQGSGQIMEVGFPGGTGSTITGSAVFSPLSGQGGGPGGGASVALANGINATGYGAGGSGGARSSSVSTGSFGGGNGSKGYVLVKEFCLAGGGSSSSSGGGGSKVTTSLTPPAGAADGEMWWKEDTGQLFIYYQDVDSSAWVQVPGVAPLAQAASTKNYIINGAMMVSQEWGNTTGNSQAFYAVDMFRDAGGGHSGTFGFSQDGAPSPGGGKRVVFNVITADAAVAAGDLQLITTVIEGYRAADLRFGSAAAKTITLRFGVRAPAGTYCVAFHNANDSRSYVAEYVIAAGEANTDVVKTITLPGDATGTWDVSNGAGIAIWWTLMAGTTYQGAVNTWLAAGPYATANQFNFMGTAGNAFHLFDVGLYAGSSAPPYVVPDFASELLLCQRYYYKWLTHGFRFAATGLSNYQIFASLPVPMRATPTVIPGTVVYSNGGVGNPILGLTGGQGVAWNYNPAAAGDSSVTWTNYGFSARL